MSRFWNHDYIRYRRSRARRRYRRNRPRPVFEVPSSSSEDEREENTNERREENTRRDDNTPVKPFKILNVDLNETYNRRAHRTDDYEHKLLIVRRGQEFIIEVTVDRKFEKGEDVIKFQLALGKDPLESKGTMFYVTPGDSLELDDCSAVIDDVSNAGSGSKIKVRMNFPHDSVVGRFTLRIRMRNKEDSGNDRKYIKHKVADPIIVLFNPWNKEDTTYMDEKLLEEYVLNDKGIVYKSGRGRPYPKKWAFGQFEPSALDAALYIMDESSLPYEAYGNPVRVTRNISAMVNSNDDSGILMGNWSGNYPAGTSPSQWNGSVKILNQFMKTKAPVKYGQCWVFSGVVTTLSRALGIPARSVTNYSSAHDTDGSMTIDYYNDEDGDPIRHMNNDSVWNFHVWNEGWFKRPDLPNGYDGWQIYDATPQESSDGTMRCGPASQKAIKKGDVHLGYDAKFVFGEVNGDKVTWEVGPGGRKTIIRVIKDSVGATISTKNAGNNAREDLTNDYKYTEGSKGERAVVMKTTMLSSKKKALEAYHKLEQARDVDFNFEGNVETNGNAKFTLKMKNTSSESKRVKVTFSIMAKYYTGIEGDNIDREKKILTLDAGAEETFSMATNGADWLNKIDEDATIGIYVHARVLRTTQVFVTSETYDIEKPEIEMKVSKSSVKAWEEVEVTMKFKNPLETPLTKASFVMEGAGINTSEEIKLGNIGPEEEVSKTIKVTPKMPGSREILATFRSRQLINIEGSVDIEVTKD